MLTGGMSFNLNKLNQRILTYKGKHHYTADIPFD